jgi:Tol biopolymer transport system component
VNEHYCTARRALVSVLLALAALLALGSAPAPAHSLIGSFGSIGEEPSIAESSALPDDRIYEMVSPAENNNADIYVPEGSLVGSASVTHGETVTERPFQASTDGDAVVYAGDPSFEGNGSGGEDRGNEYLSTRAVGGDWDTQNLDRLDYLTTDYEAFSPDLSLGILSEGGTYDSELPPLAQEGLSKYRDLYERTNNDGSFRSLFATLPPMTPHLPPIEFGFKESGAGSLHAVEEPPLYAGASADFSNILFEVDDALTPEAVYPAANDLYVYNTDEGRTRSVNVLPESEGGEPAPEASFGSYPPNADSSPLGCNLFRPNRPDFSHVISSNGSRIFWTDMKTGDLYVRENAANPDAKTVLVSEGGAFWTANSEGSEAFFTKNGDLYEFDVDTEQTIDLAPGGEVQGVVGASEDGSYIYFVADGKLAAGAEQGQPNLYLSHEGETSFIATLSPADDEYESFCYYTGDWRPTIGDRTAEVTPNGHDVVFDHDDQGTREVYVYDAESSQLTCVSCLPTGGPPSGMSYLPAGGRHDVTQQPRWISEDGSRVFFDSTSALVPRDTNGVLDVYEWERVNSGSCRDATGCIYLLSGGTNPDGSYFIDASSTGDDAFFVTRAQLVAQDSNDNYNIYDVHVGGVLPPSEAQCTGTGCQGAPLPPPVFEAPASATFDGVGNFPPPVPAPACKKGYTKRNGRCTRAARKKAKKADKRPKRRRK